MSKPKNIWSWLENFPISRFLRRILKKYSLPGFKGVPIYDVLSFIVKEARKDDLTTRANSIAFSFFIALFPTIIFLFTLLPLLPVTADYLEVLENSLSGILPDNAHAYLFGIIENVASIKRGGLLSFGFLLAIFFASSGMATIMSGFDKAYEITFKRRSFIKNRLVAIALTILLASLLILSLVFIILGQPILGRIIDSTNLAQHYIFIINMFKWILVFFVTYMGISIIYHYGPSMYKKISFWNPGSVLATLLSILASIGFSIFVNNFGRYNEVYGSIGALIVIMIWFQLNAFILLVGFELNASIAVNRDLREHEGLLDLN